MVLCTLMLAIGVCISLVVLRCHDDKDELPEADNETLTTLQHKWNAHTSHCLLYTSPSPRDRLTSRMPSSA